MGWVQYETTRAAGQRWGVSYQWVSQLCKQGRVEGAGKVGHIWIIPKDAPKPEDMRIWNGRYKRRRWYQREKRY